MLIIPAIDMKDHRAVRLKQGRMEESTVYSESTLVMAEKWIEQGAKRLHLVDLNGAFRGKPVHFDDVTAIAKKFPHVKIEIGGGIRDLKTIQKYFDHGVSFCILGTIAIKKPKIVEEACLKFPGKIILGIDAKNGMVATQGWSKTSQVSALELAQKFSQLAIESVIYTDIAKDGMLAGMNLEQIEIMKGCGFPVIASGGLTSLDDIEALKKMNGIYGVIAGKAIYEDRFSVVDAIAKVS